MSLVLRALAAHNFRLFPQLALHPGPGLNFITGANASGKTTLLEAVYGLGRARSFRSASGEDIAGPSGPYWQLRGEVVEPERPVRRLRIEWRSGQTRASLDDTETGLAELARVLPVQVLHPAAHRLLEEGPAYRRRYLDWGVFHVEHAFYPAWRRYQRALKQRNQALRTAAPDAEVQAWDGELAGAGETLHELRLSHLQQLRTRLAPLLMTLLEAETWTLELARGWPAQQDLATSLAAHLDRDRRMGQTLEGPHRAELRLRLGGHAVKNRVSRGQQKLLVAALLLAQAGLIAAAGQRPPLLLIDDFPSELGRPFQQRLLTALRASGSQVFLTALDLTALEPASGEPLFHVEHGAVSAAGT